MHQLLRWRFVLGQMCWSPDRRYLLRVTEWPRLWNVCELPLSDQGDGGGLRSGVFGALPPPQPWALKRKIHALLIYGYELP
jgi:hypothetical protein